MSAISNLGKAVIKKVKEFDPFIDENVVAVIAGVTLSSIFDKKTKGIDFTNVRKLAEENKKFLEGIHAMIKLYEDKNKEEDATVGRVLLIERLQRLL